MLSRFLLRRAFHGIQLYGEVRTHPFDVKLMVIVRLSSGSYRVRLMVDKATGPFWPPASEDAVILSGATLFSVLFEDDRQKRYTRTFRNLLSARPRTPFFLIMTFGHYKA